MRPTRVSRLCCGSLAKYVKVALGEAHVFIQHPKANGDAFVNSWDHGAGVLICEETGARVTDALGEALRFEESEDKRRFAPGRRRRDLRRAEHSRRCRPRLRAGVWR